MVKYIIIWFGLVILAIINGILRNEVFVKFVPDLCAHQISTATGLTFFSIYLWSVSSFWNIKTKTDAVLICIIWLVLTVSFEFLFGHYIIGHPWPVLLHDYNIFEGRLWVLVLLWTVFAPYAVYKLRKEK
ncbi:MAG: hypothetical protein JXA06_07010 [Bacteroidetes bacterium]|nr:hypothetical protein [Bacteroidota bacterium]